jgi:large repetitive protein
MAGDNNWDTPNNWSTHNLPGPNDDVTINVAANVAHSNPVSDSIHSLTSIEPIAISQGSLTIASASSAASVTIANGTLKVNAPLSLSGPLTLTAGTLAGSGTVTANAGIAINAAGGIFTLDGITLDNPAGQTASWVGNDSNITALNGAAFVNNGTFHAQNQGFYSSAGNQGAATSFTNDGTFTSTSTLEFHNVPFNVNGSGTVTVTSGTLTVLGGGASTGGSFTSDAGAILDIGGTYTLDSNSTISGAGTVSTVGSNSLVTMAGTYNVTGTTTLGGSATINFNGPVTSVGSTLSGMGGTATFHTPLVGSAGTIGTVSLDGGSINFGSSPLTITTLTITFGTLHDDGNIAVSGLTTLDGGTLRGSATVTANGGITLHPAGGFFTFDGVTLVNSAGQTATWSGLDSNISMLDGAEIVNKGTFQAQAQGSLTSAGNQGAATAFINNGTFTNSSSLDVNVLPFNSQSPATVTVQSGTLNLLGGGTSTGGSFSSSTGGTLNFGGTFHLDANSIIAGAGTVGFAGSVGQVTMNGTYDVTGTTMVGSGVSVNFDGPVTSVGSTLSVAGGNASFKTPLVASAGTIGTVSLDGGSVDFGSSPLTLTTLNVIFGTLHDDGNLTVSGLTTLDGGTLRGSATVTANGGTTLHPAGGFFTLDGVTLVNPANQTATWGGLNSNISMLDGADIVNNGTFQAQAQGSLTSAGNQGAAPAFINNGKFTNSSSLDVNLIPFNSQSPATVTVQSGTLNLLGGGTSTGGSFTSSTGGTLNFGGTFQLDANSVITGAGTVGFVGPSGKVTMNGTYDVTGTTVVSSDGSVNFNGPVTSVGSPLSVSGGTASFNTSLVGSAGTIGTVSLDGGSINFGSSPLTLTTLNVIFGTLHDDGNISVSGLTTLDGGTLKGSATVTANGGITLHPAGGFFTLDGVTIVNSAGQTATWSGIDSNISIVNGANFVNDGTFSAQQTQSSFSSAGTPGAPTAFTNNGTFTNTSPLLFQGVAFNSTGSVTVQSGTLSLDGGGTETGANFSVPSGSTLELERSTFSFDAASTLSGSGALTIDGGSSVRMLGNSSGFTGATTVNYASLTVDGSLSSSPITQTGGINQSLGGTGTMDSITTSGVVIPGDNLGILTVQGNVALNASATYVAELEGSTPGSGFNQLNVTNDGVVNLGGASLEKILSGFTPTAGEQFPIITSTKPIVGTFVGLPEGASLTIGSTPFQISYANDEVVLTQAVGKVATNTTASASPNPAVVGQTVTLTATVAPQSGTNTPTGTVTFTIDNVAQAPVPLQVVNGHDVATLPASNLTAGTHQITAAYSGDPAFAVSSTQSPVTLTISPLGTTNTGLTLAPNPSTVGQSVSFAAVITSTTAGTPTGSVTFSIDGSPQTPVNLQVVNGHDEAVFSTSTLGAGTHAIKASYSGDGTFAASSATQNQTVNLSTTTTTLTLAPNPAALGQPESFTAVVSSASSGTPSGAVTFSIDGADQPPVNLQVVNGQDEAVFTTSTLSKGPHTIKASYSGDTAFGSSSATHSETVNQSATTTMLTLAPNPANVGESAAFTAVVSSASSGTPSGSVTFSIDGADQPPVNLQVVNGKDEAVFNAATLGAGTHTIKATYSGDSTFGSSSATQSQVVNLHATSTALAVAPNPVNIGESVTFTAIVGSASSGTPSGSVTFSIDGVDQPPVNLQVVNGQDEAVFQTSALSAGAHAVRASYDGDSTFGPSSDASSETVNPVSTTTTLGLTTNPSTAGQPVTFIAVVTSAKSGTPEGSVIFSIDGAPLTPVAIHEVNGQDEAIFTTSSLGVGSHTIGASYGGDGTFGPSSASQTQMVKAAPIVPTSTTLISSSSPSSGEGAVTFTASVSAVSGTPTGTVKFIIDGQVGSPVAVHSVNGIEQASFTSSTLSAGGHSVAALYDGSPGYLPSVSAILAQAVVASTPLEVSSLQRFGIHAQLTKLVLGFTTALDSTTAEDLSNYQIVPLGPNGRPGSLISVSSAVYDPATHTVTLTPSQTLPFRHAFRLTVNGHGANGLVSATGVPLDGNRDANGTDFVAAIDRSTLAPATVNQIQSYYRATLHRNVAVTKIVPKPHVNPVHVKSPAPLHVRSPRTGR